jgi:cytochrome P450
MKGTVEPPRVRGLAGIGCALELARDPLGLLMRSSERHGDVFRLPVLGREWIVLNHPDDIESVLVRHAAQTQKDLYTRELSRLLGQGLLTSEGELWRRQRRLVAHAFTPVRIAAYASTMVGAAARAIEAWRPDAVLELDVEMSRVTMDVVGATLFDADVDADARGVFHAVGVLNELAAGIETALRLPAWVPTPGNLRAARAARRIDAVLGRIISERRRAPDLERRSDLLSALLLARDEQGAAMSDAQLRDECVTLFLAGHETTALTLTYALYLLSKRPEIAAAWRAELASALGGRAPAHADLPALDLTARLVKETLRLYPPAWSIGRELQQEITIRGFRLPAGAQIMFSQWVVHRDSRWYSNPQAFDPERWLDANAKALPRFAYFPFGGGPRICVGNHFAMTEAILLLALIGQRFELELLPGERLRLRPAVTLRPRGPLRVRLRRAAPPPARTDRAAPIAGARA